MATNTKEIKRRIKSISSTLQLTKALELISSVKMRHATAIAQDSRDFSDEIWQLIARLYPKNDDEKLPKLFVPNIKASKSLLLVIASDKGLAGSYNANVLRKAKEVVTASDNQFDVIAMGKKTRKVEQIAKNVNIVSFFEHTDEEFDFFQLSPISKMIIEKYREGEYKEVIVIYTDFVNTLKQVATAQTILPISQSAIPSVVEGSLHSSRDDEKKSQDNKNDTSTVDFKYEPDTKSILETLGKLAVRSQIYQAMLEASASEHSARMVAMKNATENGKELVGDLQFTFNQLRQQGITQEIAEISAGRIALAG